EARPFSRWSCDTRPGRSLRFRRFPAAPECRAPLHRACYNVCLATVPPTGIQTRRKGIPLMNFALSRSVVGMLLCACGVTVASAQLAEKPTSTRDFLQKMDAYYAQLLPDHAPATISGTGF